jgi:hypothetical protein
VYPEDKDQDNTSHSLSNDSTGNDREIYNGRYVMKSADFTGIAGVNYRQGIDLV